MATCELEAGLDFLKKMQPVETAQLERTRGDVCFLLSGCLTIPWKLEAPGTRPLSLNPFPGSVLIYFTM